MKRMEPLNRDELLWLLKAARESSARDWCRSCSFSCITTDCVLPKPAVFSDQP